MRILQVITLGLEIYGAQRHVLDLCTLLKNDGHEVKVVVGTAGRVTEILTQQGIDFVVLPRLKREIDPISDIKCIGDLRKVYTEFAPDLVASHSSKAGILARVACYLSGIPNTFTAHGWSFEEGIPFLKRTIFLNIERLAGRFSDRIIAVANTGRDLGLKHKVAPPEKLVTIWNGAEDKGAQFQKEKQDVFTMTMVAGFRKQKDHATLIDALAQLKDDTWQLFLLGNGELMEDMKTKVIENGLGDRIFFEGAVSDVPSYLNKTDLMLLITNWEGLPISILEGLSFSLPVVASDVSGVREEVFDRHNGLLVERGNVNQTKEALKELMDNPDLIEEYGRNSRLLFKEKFTREAMYEQTKSVYEEIIASKNSSP
ncbi:glycosyltransferase family 4 protein [bacterium]|nr:glycosyltransferase family 4 protein [bacterium]